LNLARWESVYAPTMRILPLTLASFVAFTVGTGCATPRLSEGRAAVLKPSMVSASFKDLDAKNPFEQAKTRVDLTKVGIANYDKFFQESAEVKGTIILADVVLDESDAFVAKIKKEVARGKALTPDQAKALDRENKRVDAITKLLTGLPEKSGQLTEQSEALTKAAPKTFAGPNALKLPGVLKGLDQSASSLKSAAEKSPALLERAGKSAAKLAELG
jgi:hypothetical protein